MKVIKADETVTYLGREHIITEVTEQGVKLKRVNALPNEYAIYIRKGSDRFFKIFSKDFDTEDIETTDDDGVDVRIEKTAKKSVQQEDEYEDDEAVETSLNDFIVNLTKKHTDFADKEEVTEYLKSELFDFADELNALKRFTISCWLNRRVLVKFQTDDINNYLSKVKDRQLNYTDELRMFIESALGDITAPSTKELKSLVSLIPEEDEELILSIIKGFDLPLLWLNQTEVKQMLIEADEASNSNTNSNIEKGRRIMATTIKGLSDNTVKEMMELFQTEAEKRGLVDTDVEADEVEDEADEDLDITTLSLNDLKAWCEDNGYDIEGLKTKKAILEAIEEQDEAGDEEDADDEAEEDEIDDDEVDDVENEEDDEEEDEEAGDEDEEGDDEEEVEPYTEEELEDFTLKDLREIASEDFGIDSEKMKKPALIEAILEAQEGGDEADEDDEDDEDEEEGDEMPDYASMSLKELRAECQEEGIDTKGLSKDDLIEELEALWEE